MGLQLLLSASLTGGPADSSDTTFPSGVLNLAFVLQPSTKPYSVSSGNVIAVVSPAPAFQTIPGIGPGQTVQQGHTLFCRCNTGLLVQYTFANPAGGPDIVITEPLQGVKLAEFPSNGFLKGLAVQGSGTFEFAVFGNS